MKALILKGEVVQVEEQDFPVAQPLKWVDVPDGLSVVPGWRFDGAEFAPPLPRPPGSGGWGGAGIGGDINIGGEGGSGLYGGKGGDAIGPGLNVGGQGGKGAEEHTHKSRWNWPAIGAIAAVVAAAVTLIALLAG